MTTSTTDRLLELHQEIAIQNQSIFRMGKSILTRVASSPTDAQAVGLAMVGTGMTIASEVTRRFDLDKMLLTVPQTLDDVAQVLIAQRDMQAAVIRELVALFARFGWDLP